MQLIEYVVNTENKRRINGFIRAAKSCGLSLEDLIIKGYCPSSFCCLEGTEYEKPLYQTGKSISRCKYDLGQNPEKCRQCWERQILTA